MVPCRPPLSQLQLVGVNFSEQGQENYILMADRSLGGEGPTGFTAEVAYNPHDEKPMLRSFKWIQGQCSIQHRGGQGLKKFTSSGPAWAFMKFQPACYAVVHYISRFGSSVAACHAFWIYGDVLGEYSEHGVREACKI